MQAVGTPSIIYCVEDDDSIRGLMLYALEAAGFAAVGFADAESLYEALREQIPQLLLLDIMLPGEDGLSILKNLRAHSDAKNLPIIMATAKGTEYDKVTGLDLGADDYLAKPFGMLEMVSRVKAVLRRCGGNKTNTSICVGNICLNPQERSVIVSGHSIQLTYKEFELLRKLATSPGIVFTREQLLDDIWDIDYPGETRTVDAHIRSLRRKLGEDGTSIRTVRNVGYKMEPDA